MEQQLKSYKAELHGEVGQARLAYMMLHLKQMDRQLQLRQRQCAVFFKKAPTGDQAVPNWQQMLRLADLLQPGVFCKNHNFASQSKCNKYILDMRRITV